MARNLAAPRVNNGQGNCCRLHSGGRDGRRRTRDTAVLLTLYMICADKNASSSMQRKETPGSSFSIERTPPALRLPCAWFAGASMPVNSGYLPCQYSCAHLSVHLSASTIVSREMLPKHQPSLLRNAQRTFFFFLVSPCGRSIAVSLDTTIHPTICTGTVYEANCHTKKHRQHSRPPPTTAPESD